MRRFFIFFLLVLASGCVGLGLYFYSYKHTSNAFQPNKNEVKSSIDLPINSDGSISFPANNRGWHVIGTGNFTLEVRGMIDYGGEKANPVESERKGDADALVPELPFGVLVAKIGQQGKPFKVGHSHKFQAGLQTVYVAVNDSYYEDNSGAYTIILKPRIPTCVESYTSGCCWTIKPPKYTPASVLPSDKRYEKSSVKIAPDGKSCTLFVPATYGNGVEARDNAGHQFYLNKGEQFEIQATGMAMFSTEHPRVGPQGMYGWYDPYVDSPFNENVGGLEFSIGPLPENRFLAGTNYSGGAEYSGVPVFRVVERTSGYGDGNYGGFTVTIKKR